MEIDIWTMLLIFVSALAGTLLCFHVIDFIIKRKDK